MDAFQIVDALAASFFGLIGIWAAVVRRHWFLRFVVVSAFLLSTILITAHQVTIEFGIQIALLMVGVWIARNRGSWQFKFSIETLLLFMVVVAIASAVVGSSKNLSWWKWHFMVSTGICTAGYALTGLWLVFGTARLRYRLPLTVLSIIAILALYHFAEGTRHAIAAHINGGGWQLRLAQHYEIANVAEWLKHNSLSVLLGTVFICTALLTGCFSGWFSEKSKHERDEQNRLMLFFARAGFVVTLLCIASPLFYIFYRLMTPTQIPVVETLMPNGYDEIIEAGKMLDDGVYQLGKDWQAIPESEKRKRFELIKVPLRKIHGGLNQPHFQSRHHTLATDEEQAAFDRSATALLLEYSFLHNYGTKKQKLAWTLRTLRLGNSTADAWEIMWPEQLIGNEIRASIKELTSAECRYLTKKLMEHESNRQTSEDYLLGRRSARENQNWYSHLRVLLQEWSGNDPYERDRWSYQMQVLNMRMLITQLALESYFLDHHKIAAKLADLVPEYLDNVPVDPFSHQQIEYRNYWVGYAVTSTAVPNLGYSYIHTGLAAPYLAERLQESWQAFQAWLQTIDFNRIQINAD